MVKETNIIQVTEGRLDTNIERLTLLKFHSTTLIVLKTVVLNMVPCGLLLSVQNYDNCHTVILHQQKQSSHQGSNIKGCKAFIDFSI